MHFGCHRCVIIRSLECITLVTTLTQNSLKFSETGPVIGENRQLVTYEPVEVEVYMKIIDHFRGIYRIYSNVTKENRRM